MSACATPRVACTTIQPPRQPSIPARCVLARRVTLTLFRVTDCVFHAKLGAKNASSSILSLNCAVQMILASCQEQRQPRRARTQGQFRKSAEIDRMSGLQNVGQNGEDMAIRST